ncbi:MAG TPA: threonine synthase [Dehalococcoidia bacterium]|jgi:threonine synthase|nr:threonine synthase [Dehalococcoidia bacterium]
MKSYLSILECTYCDAKYPHDQLINLCRNPECGKVLFPRYDLDLIKKEINRDVFSKRSPNMWRYKELMPVISESNIVSLGEGFTPLIRASNLGEKLGLKNLLIKDETMNPTGSFKARGLSSAVSKAKELGVKSITIPSAGNAGGAMAAYGALAKLETYVFMPKDTPLANKVETIAYGAKVELVDGYITDAGKFSQELVASKGAFDVSTLKEPYRVEGKKTMGFEIAEQLKWDLPEFIIYPTGGGTGIVGIWKAFHELKKLGWINGPMPKMICVQSEGCSPIVDAFLNGEDFAEPFENAHSIASGMKVPAAIGDYLVIRSLRESGGTGLKVSDQEMVRGVKDLSENEGIFAAPEGGATVAGLLKLIELGQINEKNKVLLLVTGSGFKYLDKLVPFFNN